MKTNLLSIHFLPIKDIKPKSTITIYIYEKIIIKEKFTNKKI